MNKMLSFITLSLLFLVSSCGGSDPVPDPVAPKATITLPSSEVSIAPEGETVSVRVKASAAWTVETDGQDWYKLVSGNRIAAGESLLKVEAPENVTGAARRATIRFTSGDEKAELKLVQGELVAKLAFSPDKGSVDGDGGELVFKAESNSSWTLDEESLPYWLTPNLKTIGKGASELKVKVAKSYAAEKRTAEIKYRCGNGTSSLTVEQGEGTPIEDGAYVPEGYNLVWQDDFSEASSEIVKNWRYEDWAPGHVNNERQRYVPDDRRTSFIENGVLCIKAMKDGGQVISSRMNSRESWQYAYVEAAIWLPKGKGTWPAFWMMPDDQGKGWPACGEIDIMEEVGVDANITSSSIHCDAYNHVKGTQKTASRTTAGAENEFHVYSMEWTADYIKTYVDGVLLLDFRNDKAGNDKTWPFDKKFFIILNLAWGGDWGGYAGVDESALPTTMKVDYVRVYQK